MNKSLTTFQLAERCRAEAERYKQFGQSNEVHCLELFRRALTERDETAWQAIYAQYHILVATWVQHYGRFSQTGEETAFFINEAFARLWRFGSKPETAAKLDSLGKCLSYLKMCVGSAIEDYCRKNEKDALKTAVSLESQDCSTPAFEVHVQHNLALTELRQVLWETIEASNEHLVAEESWVYGFPPRQIQARHPEVFATTEAVSQTKHKILKRLRRRLKRKTEEW